MTDPRKVPATETAYGKFRDDGWPLCPGCGDDELWSHATPATVETIVSCLRCGWLPIVSTGRIDDQRAPYREGNAVIDLAVVAQQAVHAFWAWEACALAAMTDPEEEQDANDLWRDLVRKMKVLGDAADEKQAT